VSVITQEAPRIDHHQHLFSPALAAVLSQPPPAAATPSVTARDLIMHLDAAGIERAVVLSAAYIRGSALNPSPFAAVTSNPYS
jgi:uncharacterized protein